MNRRAALVGRRHRRHAICESTMRRNAPCTTAPTRRQGLISCLAALLLGLPTISYGQGLVVPDDVANRLAAQSEVADKQSSLILGFGGSPATPLYPCSPDSPAFDLRQLGLVAEVGDQRPCNSCWAFAAGSAIETSYAYFSGANIDTSKQQLLDCSVTAKRPPDQLNIPGLYTCRGGYFDGPFNLSKEASGLLATSAYRTIDNRQGYQAQELPCRRGQPGAAYQVLDWGPIANDPSVVASTGEIKKSICKYGGVVTGIDYSDWPTPEKPQRILVVGKATPSAPQAIKAMAKHAVQIVGWHDEEAWSDPATGHMRKGVWIVKNSWGATSGDRGFLHIPYDRQAIGYLAAWVLADADATARGIPVARRADFLTALHHLKALTTLTQNPTQMRMMLDTVRIY